jgi:hypothetical protein
VRRQKQGIIFPIIIATIMLFIIITAFFIFTPLLSGFFNVVSGFTNDLGIPALTTFILPFMQGQFLIWMSGIAIFVITVIAYVILAARQDEIIE